MGFGADLAKEAANITKANQEIVKVAFIALSTRITIGTPVGNPELWITKNSKGEYVDFIAYNGWPEGYTGGTARANWFPSTSAPVSSVDLSARDESDATAKSIESFANSASYTGTYRITNNLPYIERLEDGWSTQAPAGMVKLNMTWIEEAMPRLKSQVYKKYGIKS